MDVVFNHALHSDFTPRSLFCSLDKLGAFYLSQMIGSAFTSHLPNVAAKPVRLSEFLPASSHSSGAQPTIPSTFAIQDCHEIKFVLSPPPLPPPPTHL